MILNIVFILSTIPIYAFPMDNPYDMFVTLEVNVTTPKLLINQLGQPHKHIKEGSEEIYTFKCQKPTNYTTCIYNITYVDAEGISCFYSMIFGIYAYFSNSYLYKITILEKFTYNTYELQNCKYLKIK
jgi:hypothetical protein